MRALAPEVGKREEQPLEGVEEERAAARAGAAEQRDEARDPAGGHHAVEHENRRERQPRELDRRGRREPGAGSHGDEALDMQGAALVSELEEPRCGVGGVHAGTIDRACESLSEGALPGWRGSQVSLAGVAFIVRGAPTVFESTALPTRLDLADFDLTLIEAVAQDSIVQDGHLVFVSLWGWHATIDSLTQVPEPTSAVLLAAGIAGFAAARSARRGPA